MTHDCFTAVVMHTAIENIENTVQVHPAIVSALSFAAHWNSLFAHADAHSAEPAGILQNKPAYSIPRA